MPKSYLGDSVYVDIENGALKLTTENGLPTDPSNTILLEPEVYRALREYVNREKVYNRPEGQKGN